MLSLHPKGQFNQSLFQVVLFGKYTAYACGNWLEMNALSPMDCKSDGKLKLVKLLLAKANAPIDCKFWLKFTCVRPCP